MAEPVAVALVIAGEPDGASVLAVRRPEDKDDEFPGMWGLPAATVRPGEMPQQAAQRAARDKLAIEVRDLRLLREGTQQRGEGRLRMLLFGARAATWPPRVDGQARDAGVTHYTAWRWARPEELAPTAERGSLCVQLLLKTENPRG